MSSLNVHASFSNGSAVIPGTVFKGGQTSRFRSVRNTNSRGFAEPMATLSFSISKGITQLQENVVGFGKAQVNGEERYVLELKRPKGSMVLQYAPQQKAFFHECEGIKNGFCYHIFELIAAVRLVEEPNGEFASHFKALDFSNPPIQDEENFFIASDALYFDAMEHFHGQEVLPPDIPNGMEIIVDFTPDIVGRPGQFSIPTNLQTTPKAKPSKKASLQINWGRDFTPEEEALLFANAEQTKGMKIPKNLMSLATQISEGTVISCLFMGDSGSGKTTAAHILARELNVPIRGQNFSLNAEESDIIGGFVPVPAGGFQWVDGELTKTFRHGGIYVAEEINFGKPGVLGILNNMLDGVGQIVLQNGEVIPRHPHFRFIAAMNVGYAGTHRMNVALINRFERVVKFDTMEAKRQVQVIMEASGYTNQDVVEKMVDAGTRIQLKIKTEQIDGAVISIRNLINWAKDVKVSQDILGSAYATVVWPVCYEDEDVQKEIYEDIIYPRFHGVGA